MGKPVKNRPSQSVKRKSRKQIAKRYLKKTKESNSISLNNMDENIFDNNETTPQNQNVFNSNIDQGVNFTENDLSDDVFMTEPYNSKEPSQTYEISGRRIVDIGHLFSCLKSIKHDIYGCNFSNLNIINEKRLGLKSLFTYKCNMCGIMGTFSTENDTQSKCGINEATACGTIATGAGHSQLSEFCSALDIPQMSERTYSIAQSKIFNKIEELAHEEMAKAAKEESRLAVEAGEVDIDGTPNISVIVDGAWCKRSYKSNYNALSGVACIIGARTKKNLYLGVKNKFCRFCQKYKKAKQEIPRHNCFKNWVSTSTSMEGSIILEGFKRSVEMYNLRYNKVIGDGDSSVYRKIRNAKPYGPNFFIEKIECRNHVLRNFCSKIREIAKTPRTDINIKKFLRNNILKFRTAIVSAIKHRKMENIPLNQKIENLKNDILNAPSHIFGDHFKCASYFCNKSGQPNQILHNDFLNSSLSQLFMQSLIRVANLSSSLLYDVDNNIAESYNSVVNKFVGGKRVNYSLGGSYQGRCYAAAISFNNKGTFVYKLWEKFYQNNVGIYTKQFYEKKINLADKKKNYKRQKTRLQSADSDYGRNNDNNIKIPDMSPEIFENKKSLFLHELSKADEVSIEKNTRGQNSNPQWEREREIRLTASNFGKICKMKLDTNTANTVKNIVCTKKSKIKSLPKPLQYGLDNERSAKLKFEEITKIKITECGFFVDSEKKYLGASPDGLIGLDSIVEIKCPYSARDKMIVEAIDSKLIDFCIVDPDDYKNIKLKPFHNYMYQVQGQLHITKRSKCYFIVYTQVDCE